MMTKRDVFLTRAEAAEYLGLSAKTLANRHSEGVDCPPVVYVGPSSPRYSLQALKEWAETRRAVNSTEGDARKLTTRGRRKGTRER